MIIFLRNLTLKSLRNLVDILLLRHSLLFVMSHLFAKSKQRRELVARRRKGICITWMTVSTAPSIVFYLTTNSQSHMLWKEIWSRYTNVAYGVQLVIRWIVLISLLCCPRWVFCDSYKINLLVRHISPFTTINLKQHFGENQLSISCFWLD